MRYASTSTHEALTTAISWQKTVISKLLIETFTASPVSRPMEAILKSRTIADYSKFNQNSSLL